MSTLGIHLPKLNGRRWCIERKEWKREEDDITTNSSTTVKRSNISESVINQARERTRQQALANLHKVFSRFGASTLSGGFLVNEEHGVPLLLHHVYTRFDSRGIARDILPDDEIIQRARDYVVDHMREASSTISSLSGNDSVHSLNVQPQNFSTLSSLTDNIDSAQDQSLQTASTVPSSTDFGEDGDVGSFFSSEVFDNENINTSATHGDVPDTSTNSLNMLETAEAEADTNTDHGGSEEWDEDKKPSAKKY
jgi:hypothetical protein